MNKNKTNITFAIIFNVIFQKTKKNEMDNDVKRFQ